jgi:hypothetical protein
MGKRLTELEQARSLYEQGIVTTELIIRNNQQLDRGFDRIVSPATDTTSNGGGHELLSSALAALTGYVEQALPMMAAALRDLEGYCVVSTAYGEAAEAVKRAGGDLNQALGLE